MLHNKGYNLKISKFIQLGNSLIQLCNAINVGIETKSKVTMPVFGTCSDAFDMLKDVPDFDFKQISYQEDSACNEELESKFFFKEEAFDYTLTNDQRRELLQKYIYPHLKLTDVENITDKTLVIHIRSGDIFGGWIHKDYVQPPLSFYKKIITETNSSDILIVTQKDKTNPCIDGLLSWNPNIRLQTGSLREDVSTILKARKLVIGFGSFGWMLSLMSDNIRSLFCPISVHDLISSSFDTSPFSIKRYTFDRYIERGNWQCTEDQKELMLTYSENRIGETNVNEHS